MSSTKHTVRLISVATSCCGMMRGVVYHSHGRKPNHSCATCSNRLNCPRTKLNLNLSML